MKQFVAPSKKLIDGVVIKSLSPIVDDRGYLMEMLRCDESFYEGAFGQVYLTCARPGAIKGVHIHKKQIDAFCCVSGLAKVVLYDMREDSPTYQMVNEVYMGRHCPKLLKIPTFVAHGFTAVGAEETLIINITNFPYDRDDPDEFRIDTNDIPYDWFKLAVG